MSGLRFLALWALLACPAWAACEGNSCTRHQEHLLIQRRHGLQKVSATADSVVEQHGRLRVEGNKVVGEHGNPVRLRGMSLFWSQWQPQYWSAETIQWLKDDWKVTFVRCAMAVEAGGYLENRDLELEKLETVVQAAIDAGIYVVIDWHDHNADQHVEQSKEFFSYVAQKYGSHSNVMFEVFNEPVRQSWNETIKPYHEQIVPVIREHTDNIIILGTRFWSQGVDEAAEDPVAGTNLAYTVHFYANSHKQELRDKVVQALDKIAVFATEWGTCDASGDGTLNFNETQTWLDFFEQHHISDANWAVSDKEEACSALLPGASGEGGWETCELTKSGHFVRASLRGEELAASLPEPCPKLTTPPPGMCSSATDDCSVTRCCNDLGSTCYRKNEYWASCRVSCTPGEDPSDPPEYRAPWSCEVLTRDGFATMTKANTSIAEREYAGSSQMQPVKKMS